MHRQPRVSESMRHQLELHLDILRYIFCAQKKVYEVHFEIAHLIYQTNYVLKRYRNNISESCTFCYSGTETILHLFYECIYVKLFWTEVEHVFESLCGFKIKLQKRDIIFFYEENEWTETLYLY